MITPRMRIGLEYLCRKSPLHFHACVHLASLSLPSHCLLLPFTSHPLHPCLHLTNLGPFMFIFLLSTTTANHDRHRKPASIECASHRPPARHHPAHAPWRSYISDQSQISTLPKPGRASPQARRDRSRSPREPADNRREGGGGESQPSVTTGKL